MTYENVCQFVIIANGWPGLAIKVTCQKVMLPNYA